VEVIHFPINRFHILSKVYNTFITILPLQLIPLHKTEKRRNMLRRLLHPNLLLSKLSRQLQWRLFQDDAVFIYWWFFFFGYEFSGIFASDVWGNFLLFWGLWIVHVESWDVGAVVAVWNWDFYVFYGSVGEGGGDFSPCFCGIVRSDLIGNNLSHGKYLLIIW